MMERSIILADVHNDDRTSTGRDTQACVELALLEVFRVARNSPIYMLGDILHKSNAHTDVILRLNQFLHSKEFKEANVSQQVYVVGGNHELTPKNNSVLQLVDWPKNFKLVIHMPYMIEEQKIALVPFINGQKYIELIQRIPDNWIVMSHGLIDGVVDGVKLNSTIKPSLFKRFKMVFMGDVHKRQKVGKNIIYTGNLIQTSQNDIGKPQGYIEVDKGKIRWRNITQVKPLAKKANVSPDDELRVESILTADVPVAASLSDNDANQYIRKFVDSLANVSQSVKKEYINLLGVG